jgi:hypothetical protein
VGLRPRSRRSALVAAGENPQARRRRVPVRGGQSFITNLQLSGGYGSNDLYLIRRLRKPPAVH